MLPLRKWSYQQYWHCVPSELWVMHIKSRFLLLSIFPVNMSCFHCNKSTDRLGTHISNMF